MDASVIRDVVVPVVATATFAWGLYVARRGWRDGLAIRKVQFIRDYTNDFYSTAELATIVFDIDYGRYNFSEKKLGSREEIDLDRLLDFLNTLGLAVHEKIISADDLRKTTIGYAARIVWEDARVRWYLHHIAQQDLVTGSLAFQHFRLLGESLSGPLI